MHKTSYMFFSMVCARLILFFLKTNIFSPRRSRRGTLGISSPGGPVEEPLKPFCSFFSLRRLSSSVVFQRGSLRQTLDLSKTTNEKVPWRRPSTTDSPTAHHRRPFPTGTKKSFYVRKSFYSRQLYYQYVYLYIYTYIDMIYQYPKLQTDLFFWSYPLTSSSMVKLLYITIVTTKSCRIYRTILDHSFELSYFGAGSTTNTLW